MKLPQLARLLKTLCRTHRLVSECRSVGCEMADQIKANALHSTRANIATVCEAIQVSARLAKHGGFRLTWREPLSWIVEDCRGIVLATFFPHDYSAISADAEVQKLAAKAAACEFMAPHAIRASV